MNLGQLMVDPLSINIHLTWLITYSVSVLGILVFQLKRRPPDHIPKKSKKHADGKPLQGKERADGSAYGSTLPPEKLPYLVELSPGERPHWACCACGERYLTSLSFA